MQKIFAQLAEAGLMPLDIVQLEQLSNPVVLARCDFGTKEIKSGRLWWKQTRHEPEPHEYDNKQHVITYLRAWADLLTEEGAQDVPSERRSATLIAKMGGVK